MTELLETIEEAIKTTLATGGFTNVVHLDAKPQADDGDMTTPLARIVTQNGDFERVGQIKLKCTVKIIVIIDFKHAANATDKNRGVYPLLFGIIGCLFNKTVGLSTITPIKPISFARDFETEKGQAGIVTYNLVMETSYYITEMDDETAVDLMRVGLEYFLQDPEDDGRMDGSDLVDLTAHPYVRFPRTVFDSPFITIQHANNLVTEITVEPVRVH